MTFIVRSMVCWLFTIDKNELFEHTCIIYRLMIDWLLRWNQMCDEREFWIIPRMRCTCGVTWSFTVAFDRKAKTVNQKGDRTVDLLNALLYTFSHVLYFSLKGEMSCFKKMYEYTRLRRAVFERNCIWTLWHCGI